MRSITINWRPVRTLAPLMLVCLGSCLPEFILNNTASLGGDIAGGRGALDIVFDNQTPYRAIFTFGVYDPQNKNAVPAYGQFAVNNSQPANQFNRGLPANTTTAIRSFVSPCGRLVSFGGEDMIDRIQKLDIAPLSGAPIVEAAFRTGIYFIDTPVDGADPNAEQSSVIHIDAVNSFLGTDYECDARLLYQFVIDPNDANNVLVYLTVIPVE